MANLIDSGAYRSQVKRRNARTLIMQRLSLATLAVSIIVLALLLLNVVNQAFGLVAQRYTVDPDTLAERPLAELSPPELAAVLLEHVPRRLLVIVRDNLYRGDPAAFTRLTLGESIDGDVPETVRELLPTDLPEAERNRIFAGAARPQCERRRAACDHRRRDRENRDRQGVAAAREPAESGRDRS
ncbi:MAG: hypothetical protein HND48_05060 [Chloroflexi bacterium]|nr:hypothetical protein [Chloroflexota bacterium]